MDDKQRLQLQNMIKANNTEDYTQSIRDLKHSSVIKDDVIKLVTLRSKYTDPDELNMIAAGECNFLYTFYTDIYNKLRKDEIDLNILLKFIDALHKIEIGEYDQHEASFKVGTLLKELYVDSALKKSEKIDKEHEGKDVDKVEPKKADKNISWKQFKLKDA